MVRRDIFKGAVSRRRIEMTKAKRRCSVSRAVMNLILSLAGSSKSWVIDSNAPFHATFHHEIFQNYMKGDIGEVYLGDDQPSNIVGKGDETVSLSNGSTLKLKDIRYVSKLKRYLISVGQLADAEMKTNFNGNLCKITKRGVITTHGKKEGILYMTSGSTASISIASSDVDAGTWQH